MTPNPAPRHEAPGPGDFGRDGRSRQQLPPLARGTVTQHSIGAAGENGRHPSSLGRQLAVADRVDTAMQQMQLPALTTALDLVLADPELEKLAPANHAMLPPGDPCNCSVHPIVPRSSPVFTGHRPVKTGLD